MKLQVALLAAAAAIAGRVLAQPAPISDAVWLAPETDLVSFLTSAPAECLARPDEKEARYKVDIGRVAFRSPFLLGGQAARGRLSCSACHVNGRGNRDFFIDGLSTEPGTADVTSSIFSAVREDGLLNARPIPDLLDLAMRAERAHGVDKFIEGVVVDEFQGRPPPREVIDGLVAYVSSLRSSACEEGVVRLTPRRDMRHVARALAVADAALIRGDAVVADFALLAAQAELGRIAERYPNSPEERADLTSVAELIAGTRAIAPAAAKGARVRIAEAELAALRISYALNRARRASLYDRETAAAYLASYRPAAD
ncbi:MAG: hypothetical protein ACK4NP_02605 [Parvularculaceae bacterium]